MSFVLHCPNCGAREVTDFAYGGECNARPRSRPSERELNAYIHMRRNVAGAQLEWWYHRSGCRAWFIAQRDTVSNAVGWTALPENVSDRGPAGTAGSRPSGSAP